MVALFSWCRKNALNCYLRLENLWHGVEKVMESCRQKEMEAKDSQLKMMGKPSKPDAIEVAETSTEPKIGKKIFIEEVDSSEDTKSAAIKPVKKSAAAIKPVKKSADSSKDIEPQPAGKRIKSYDYASWEKFDVDKALVSREFVDKQVSTNTGPRSAA